MLDPTYSYNPYLDYDEDNEAHYRYDQSAALQMYLELPELPHEGRSKPFAACATVNCVGFPWPGAEPVRGFDIMDMIEPNCLTDPLLTQMLMVQFGGNRDELVILVSVTKVLTSCRGDLDNVFSQPKAVPELCARLFHCRRHVYSFIRDGHFVGILVDHGDPQTVS